MCQARPVSKHPSRLTSQRVPATADSCVQPSAVPHRTRRLKTTCSRQASPQRQTAILTNRPQVQSPAPRGSIRSPSLLPGHALFLIAAIRYNPVHGARAMRSGEDPEKGRPNHPAWPPGTSTSGHEPQDADPSIQGKSGEEPQVEWGQPQPLPQRAPQVPPAPTLPSTPAPRRHPEPLHAQPFRPGTPTNRGHSAQGRAGQSTRHHREVKSHIPPGLTWRCMTQGFSLRPCQDHTLQNPSWQHFASIQALVQTITRHVDASTCRAAKTECRHVDIALTRRSAGFNILANLHL